MPRVAIDALRYKTSSLTFPHFKTNTKITVDKTGWYWAKVDKRLTQQIESLKRTPLPPGQNSRSLKREKKASFQQFWKNLHSLIEHKFQCVLYTFSNFLRIHLKL